MPSSLTAVMEAEMKQNIGEVHPVVELTLGGTVYRFAEQPIVSKSAGIYLPYIPDGGLGQRSRTANISEFSLETPTFRFKIFDADRVLQKLFGGPLRAKVRNSAVQVWWRSPNVAAASHYLDFSGVITDYGVTDRVFDFSAQANIAALDAPALIPPWSKEDWLTMPDEVDGTPNRVIYGTHSSTGIAGSFGMIKCVPLEEEGNGNVDVWGVCLGRIKSTPRIYIGETLRTSDFQLFDAFRGTGFFSVVEYTGGNPHPTKDSDVRCDVDGLTTLPDGTGTVMVNPATQLRHFLKTFVHGDGKVLPYAAWSTETGKPIASPIFDRAENFFRFRNWEGGMVIESGRSGRNVTDEWCRSWGAAPFFSDTWGFAAIPRDDGEITLYYDDRHAAQKLDYAKMLTITTTRQDPITDLYVNYVLDDSRSTFTRSQLIAWRRAGQQLVAKTLDLTDGRRSVV